MNNASEHCGQLRAYRVRGQIDERRDRYGKRVRAEEIENGERSALVGGRHCSARSGGPGPVAAKCREIVILQSQREFTLAASEI